MPMRKRIVSIITVLLLLSGLLAAGFPVQPAVRADEGVLQIRTKEDWLSFAENCRTDSYSRGLQVELKAELDLSGETDIMVPVFCGVFNGGGHKVSGIRLSAETDTAGLFRVIGKEGTVSALTVSGEIRTEKERTATGLLCGQNQGMIRNCRAEGIIKSYSDVGAIAGSNLGLIEGCSSEALTEGTFRTGGIAGTNEGTITGCTNGGTVNQEPKEAATNTGGIAGLNTGDVLYCVNTGEIGYLSAGYNVGGIVGLSRGFLEGCTNKGAVRGRRDVGGIAGQLEPSFRLEYGKNAMKLLDNSVSGFADSLDQTMAVIEGAVNEGAYGLSDVFWRLNSFGYGFRDNVTWLFSQNYWIQDAAGYIEALRAELGYLKDALPVQGDLSAVISRIEAALDSLAGADPYAYEEQLEQLMYLLASLAEKTGSLPLAGDHISNLSGLFRALAETVTGGFQSFGENSTWILEDTLAQLSGLRGSISGFLSETQEDISGVRASVGSALASLSSLQASVEEVLNGKNTSAEDLSSQVEAKENGMIVSSGNEGRIKGDYNIGGILGNLSAELSLDQESDALPSLDDLLFTDTTLFVRATVYSCSNSGDIDAKYDYTGGIAGYGTRGGIYSCESSGSIRAGRSFAGGTAGCFRGTVEDSAAIGKISAQSYAGGIAGEARQIRFCRAIPVIDASGADCGAIAGKLDSGEGNLFVNDSMGGVNGISYEEVSRAVSYEELTGAENVPESFRSIQIRFVADGEEAGRTSVPYGSAFPKAPEIAPKEGSYWSWEEPEEDAVYYSQTVSGEWKKYIRTIATDEMIPEFLAEGFFDDSAVLSASEEKPSDSIRKAKVLFPNTLKIDLTPGSPKSFRVQAENSDLKELTVRWHQEEAGYICRGTDDKTKVSFKRDGKYYVFPLENGGTFTFVPAPELSWFDQYQAVLFWSRIGLLAAALAALIAGAILRRRKTAAE